MSPDLIRALATSGTILIAVVVLTIVISIAVVRRGEAAMAEDARRHGDSTHHG